jgi:hypothetical protein
VLPVAVALGLRLPKGKDHSLSGATKVLCSLMQFEILL